MYLQQQYCSKSWRQTQAIPPEEDGISKLGKALHSRAVAAPAECSVDRVLCERVFRAAKYNLRCLQEDSSASICTSSPKAAEPVAPAVEVVCLCHTGARHRHVVQVDTCL